MANFAQCLKEITTQEEEFVTIRKQKDKYARAYAMILTRLQV